MTAGELHLVVPRGIDDPLRPSGGNTYDRRVCAALRDLGWRVEVLEVEGGWPWTAALGSSSLQQALADVPDGSVVVVDGLLASRLPGVVRPAAARLRLVLLVHLPAGVADAAARLPERQVLAAASAVVTPSAWTRDWLLGEYALDPADVHVAHPGVDPASPAVGSEAGGILLSVGAISAVKGQDLLLAALVEVRDLSWTCTAAGSDTVDVGFADRLRKQVAEAGLDGRFVLAGPLDGDDLDAAYAAADLLVLPSRVETFGIVVGEALSHGVPVLATDVGGVREALGRAPTGRPPGLLVAPSDLAPSLRHWLTDAPLRAALRAAALDRRRSLTGWSVTGERVAAVLREVAA